jgi:hypothetical protein
MRNSISFSPSTVFCRLVLHSNVLLLHGHGLELLLLAATEQEEDYQEDDDGDHNGDHDTRYGSCLDLLGLLGLALGRARHEVHELGRDI